jgi:hypothetical protein
VLKIMTIDDVIGFKERLTMRCTRLIRRAAKRSQKNVTSTMSTLKRMRIRRWKENEANETPGNGIVW